MQNLKEQMASISLVDEPANADLYTHIEKNILPHIDRNAPSPPSLLIYAARRLVEPKITCDDIPSLLELLANIEAVRQRAVDQARTALKLQKKFVESEESGVQLLNKADLKKLKNLVDEGLNDSFRLILREVIVLNLCRLYIIHLWTSPESFRITKIMRTYFPSNYIPKGEGDPFADERWQGLLHHDLSHAERERVHAVGNEMKSFLSRALEWDIERKNELEKLGLKEYEIFGEGEHRFYTPDFDAKFRGSIDEVDMLKNLKGYLAKVQRMVDTLEKLFPSAQQRLEEAVAALHENEADMETSRSR